MSNSIYEVTNIWFRKEVIGKSILFDDDTSVVIDLDDNSIMDYDGMTSVSEPKIKAIEERLSITITR